jgi:DNA uptake protein ComE-like DNA-binding protein
MLTLGLVVAVNRRIRATIAVQVLLAVALIAGCTANNSRNDQQVRQQAAQATTQAKQGAQQAGQTIKEGAASAERTINDVAAGVKDGLKTPTAATNDAVDINSATENQLTTLPGVGNDEAGKIIQNRPYDTPHDLVKKGVMDQGTFDKISNRVVVR